MPESMGSRITDWCIAHERLSGTTRKKQLQAPDAGGWGVLCLVVGAIGGGTTSAERAVSRLGSADRASGRAGSHSDC